MSEALAEQLLQKICNWAGTQHDVRVLILTGSYARGRADQLSDFDIEVFARDPEWYVRSDSWMSEIGPMLMYLPLHSDAGYPTRLTMFKDGLKVDFTICSVAVLADMVDSRKLPPLYNRGYRVLVDKDRLTSRLPTASLKPIVTGAPTEAELTNVVQEFWFEAYHVAKYLKRDDLWAAKFRDWGLKGLLLKMLEWHEKSLHGWDYDTEHLGIRMKEWGEPNIWARLKRIFARFDSRDSWRALRATMSVFREIAQDTASRLRYRYPGEVDQYLSGYVDSLGPPTENANC